MSEARSAQKTACIAYGRGCSRTQIGVARLSAYFEANGWAVTNRVEEADLVAVSTCGVTESEERQSHVYLSSVRRRMRPGARLVASGCLPSMYPDGLVKGFDAFPLSKSSGAELDCLVDAALPYDSMPDEHLVSGRLRSAKHCFSTTDHLRADVASVGVLRAAVAARRYPAKTLRTLRGRRTAGAVHDDAALEPFHIRTSHGCLSECTYCAIRLASGEFYSKPLGEVIEEFELGLAEGRRRFHLVGEDVGAYGREMGLTIVDLLNALLDRPEEIVLGWDDFSPRWLVEHGRALGRVLARYARKIGSAGFPLQSGSDRILEAMNRGYRADEAERALLALRRAVPDTPLTTHVLLGFPGETRRDFMDTVGLLRSVRFDHVVPYLFSPRPGTEAADLPGRVGRPRMLARHWELKARLAADR